MGRWLESGNKFGETRRRAFCTKDFSCRRNELEWSAVDALECRRTSQPQKVAAGEEQKEEHGTCIAGYRADEAGRTRLRHLQPSAARQHHISGNADRRSDREPGDRADALS